MSKFVGQAALGKAAHRTSLQIGLGRGGPAIKFAWQSSKSRAAQRASSQFTPLQGGQPSE